MKDDGDEREHLKNNYSKKGWEGERERDSRVDGDETDRKEAN